LPGLILFVVELMRIFVNDCQERRIHREWMTGWVVLVHVCATALYLYFGVIHFGTYVGILCSLGWMLGLIWSVGSERVAILLLWIAIVIQPFEVYSHIATIHPPKYQWPYYSSYGATLPSVEAAQRIMNKSEKLKAEGLRSDLPYFSTRWHYDLLSSVDNGIINNYRDALFIAYDSIERVSEKIDQKQLERSLGYLKNVAYVYSENVDEGQRPFLNKANIITSQDKDFELLNADINDVFVRTKFEKQKFLVRTQEYHSQWHVFIDGEKAQLLRTNGAFQGLWVPAGEHSIHWQFAGAWRYVLAYFLIGLYVIVLGWVLWLCFRLRRSI
jgi:hypothetical protein